MGSVSSILQTFGPSLTGWGVPGFVLNTALAATERTREASRVQTLQKQAYDQLLAQQKLEEDQLTAKNELERQNLALEAQANDARRRNALRRAVARQKTLFSAQGISPADSGSNEAVLLGLYDDSRAEASEEDRLNNLRRAALDQNLSLTHQKNLLQAAQLGQQQELYRVLNGYGG